MAKLTNTTVEKFKCREGKPQDTLWDTETRGFGVRVSADGKTRTYYLQFRVKGTGKERLIKIGRHNDPWRVDDARTKALALKALMEDGVDPVAKAKQEQEERQRQQEEDKAQTITLRAVMEHYLIHKRTTHGGPLRPASKRDIERHVTVNLADWADKPIAKITRDTCLARFNTLTERAPGQANQCMVNLRALINHAREMFSTDDGDYPLFPVNPVTRMFKLRKPNVEKPKDGRIPLERVGAVWAMLQKRRSEARTVDDRTAADWVCSILLTGTRRTESGSLKWANVNLDDGTFHLPGDVVKNHHGITIPISTTLRELLTERKALPPVSEKVARRRSAERPTRDGSDYVFSSWSKAGYITDARAVMEAVSKVAGTTITIHDLRRTFDDIATKCLIDSDQRRQLLNHKASDVHGEHYSNNPDPKTLAPAVEAVANWVTGQGAIAEAMLSGDNVIPFRG